MTYKTPFSFVRTLIAIIIMFSLSVIPAFADGTTANSSNAGNNLNSTTIEKSMVQGAQNLASSAGIANIEKASYTFDFIKVFTSTLVNYAQSAYQQFEGPCGTIMSYLLGIWIIYKVTLIFIGGGDANQNTIWDIAKKCMLFFAIYSLILGQNSITYWNTFINIPLNITIKLGQGIIAAAYTGSIPTCSVPNGSETINSLPDQLGCISAIIERAPHIGMVIGTVILTGTPSFSIESITVVSFIGMMFNLFSGLFVIILYLMNMAAFAFIIIDLTVKICVISSLAPLFLGMYFLKPTRNYAKNALNQLVGGYIEIIACCFTVAISTNLLGAIAQNIVATVQANSKTFGFNTAANTADPVQTWLDIFSKSLNSGNTTAINNIAAQMTIFSGNFWAIVAVGIFMVIVNRKVTQLLSSIFSATHFTGMRDLFMPIANNAIMIGGTRGIKKIMEVNRNKYNKMIQTPEFQARRARAIQNYETRRQNWRAEAGNLKDTAYHVTNKIDFIRKTREFLDGGDFSPKYNNPFNNNSGNGNQNNSNGSTTNSTDGSSTNTSGANNEGTRSGNSGTSNTNNTTTNNTQTRAQSDRANFRNVASTNSRPAEERAPSQDQQDQNARDTLKNANKSRPQSPDQPQPQNNDETGKKDNDNS